MNATDKERLALFDRLAASFRWAMSQTTDKTDSRTASRWFCPHCNGEGTGYRPDPVKHKLDCPWLQAQHVLDDINDPEVSP